MKLAPISLILGLVAASVPAQAAPAPSALQVRQFLADYGTCIAKREPDRPARAHLDPRWARGLHTPRLFSPRMVSVYSLNAGPCKASNCAQHDIAHRL